MSLSPADFAVLAAVLAATVAIGWRFREEADTRDFFLGGRKIPVWAATFAFVATEVSAVTVVSVPATAYAENLNYLQFFAGAAVARVWVAWLFIPAFYKYDCTTVYEYLRHRFGPRTQKATTVLFFLTRLLGSAVRLMAASMAIAILVGWPVAPTIAAFTVISALYIGVGGIRAAIWNNVLQSALLYGGALATLAFLGTRISGGWPEALRLAGAAGRLDVVRWGASFADPNLVWVAFLNGLFHVTASFGTDQDMAQRYLVVPGKRASQRALLWTIAASLTVVLLYMAVGTGLFAYYAQNPGASARADEIFPRFIASVMPAGLRGLLFTVIVLASIDSPLAGLASSFVTDLYKPALPGRSERHYVRVSRGAVVAFALLLGGLAYAFSFAQGILWWAFKVGGVTFGALLGVFLLGLWTKRGSEEGNIAAMAVSTATNAVLLYLIETKTLALGWSWLVLLGTVQTFVLGWLAKGASPLSKAQA